MCLCRNEKCKKMLADCGNITHPGWYCYNCAVDRIVEVKQISRDKARIGLDFGNYEVNDNYEVVVK